MRLKLTHILLFGIIAAQTAQATVTLQLTAGALRDSSGNIVPNNTTMVMVSDTNGFGNLSQLGEELLGVNLAVGTSFGDGLRILQVVGATDLNAGDFGFSSTLSDLDLAVNGLTGAAGTAGTDFAILWFPGLTGTAAQTLTSNQSFGFYRSDSIDSGSWGGSIPGEAISFNIPSDPGVYSLAAVDTNLGGGIPTSAFNAAGTVGAIPEPSRSMLAFIGLIALIGRRRRL